MTDDEMLKCLERAVGLVADVSADRNESAHKRLMTMSDNDVLGLVIVLSNAVASSSEASGKLLKLLAQKSAQIQSMS